MNVAMQVPSLRARIEAGRAQLTHSRAAVDKQQYSSYHFLSFDRTVVRESHVRADCGSIASTAVWDIMNLGRAKVAPPNLTPPGKMANKKRELKNSAGSGPNSRASERYRLNLPTMCWELGGARDSAVPTQTADISRNGMFLRGKFPLLPGSMISFEVKLPCVGEQPGGVMVGQATVVRNETSPKGRTGIGALIHQCEVWPASRSVFGSRVRSPNAGSPAAESDKRSGSERRKNDRRAAENQKRRAAAAAERRKRARRAKPRRRKDTLQPSA